MTKTYRFENGDYYGQPLSASAQAIGATGPTGAVGSSRAEPNFAGMSMDPPIASTWPPKYKYKEDEIIRDFHAYIDKTYGQHYMTEEQNIECFDVWLALGDSLPTFRNTAIKYLWRYGKKNGSNKADLMKVLHYTLMMLYNDHYKDKK
jgi:hypothetical protein